MEIFDYEDVQLIPNKCLIESRSQADPSITFGGHHFKLPVVPANMATVIDEQLATWMAEHDYFYIMHRFEPETRLPFVRKMAKKHLISSISVGVKPNEKQFIDDLTSEKLTPDFITIDVAHGHANSVIEMIHYIKKRLPKAFVIAGNVATPDAVRELEDAGADATKVGVGPGKVCITKLKTGFGTGGWQLAAVRWCAKAARKPIIADGGIRHNGDVAKSIRFGASMVMIGSLFAGHRQSPGHDIMINHRHFKQYYGSASENQKGGHKNVEGKDILVDYRGEISDTLTEMTEDLQSSISYAGGSDLTALKTVDYVNVRNTLTHGD